MENRYFCGEPAGLSHRWGSHAEYHGDKPRGSLRRPLGSAKRCVFVVRELRFLVTLEPSIFSPPPLSQGAKGMGHPAGLLCALRDFRVNTTRINLVARQDAPTGRQGVMERE
jgi:hypothetical protein